MRNSGLVLDLRSPNPDAPAPVNVKDWSRNGWELGFNGTDLTGYTRDADTGLWVLKFNGTDDFLQNLAVDINLQNDATVLVWAYYDTSIAAYDDGADRYILRFTDVGANNEVNIYKWCNDAWAIFWRGNTAAELTSHDDITKAGKWTLFGLRKSGTDLDLILDGVIVATEPATTNHNANLTRLTIGPNWPGSIDEVLIWRYALSPTTIYNIWSSEVGRYH